MRLVKTAVASIAMLSVIGCFGFSAVSALPETRWNGSDTLRNNRSYVVDSRVVIDRDAVVPPETILTLTDEAELVISENASLTIEGGVNLQQGSVFACDGNITVSDSGTLSMYGKTYLQENSFMLVSGALNIRAGGLLQAASRSSVDTGGIVTVGGALQITRDGSIVNLGEIYTENSGEIISGGDILLEEGSIFDSAGHLTLERKGNIFVFGQMTLREGSTLTEAGRIIESQSGEFTDMSVHTDLSIFTTNILQNEEEVILRGIDVSWVQGDIDWEAVAESGIDFVMIRAGRGDIDDTGCKADTHFYQNIQEASKYDIDIGVYFYSYAETISQAEEEAYFLLDLIKDYDLTFPVVVDMEEETRRIDLTDVAEAFIEIVAGGGYYPMLYSYQSRLESHFSDSLKSTYALWVARIDSPDSRPETDFDYYIWQYSHEGRINGIEGNVDFNIAFRDFPDILKDYELNGMTRD